MHELIKTAVSHETEHNIMQIAANAIPGVVFPTLTAIHFHHDPAEDAA